MNLVRMIEEQLSGDALGKLSSVLGADPETTSSAASAAVPTMLSGLAKLASNMDGVTKLSNVLGNLDTGAAGNFAGMLGGDSGGLLGKGTGLLSSLFGDGMTTAAANAISRFSGLSPAMTKSLLAYLLPLVLGKLAGQWRSQGATTNALTSIFADQKRNIADAMPAGFSLADIPGLEGGAEAMRSAAATTRRSTETVKQASPSLAGVLVPLALLVVGGFILWNMLRPRPAAEAETAQATATQGEQVTAMKPAVPDMPALPSAAQLSDDLNATFKTLGETFTSIKDAASADAAMPKLEELNAKIGAIKKMFAQLPEAGRATLQKTVDEQLKPTKESAERTLALPGISDRIKALISEIVQKLEEWHVIERTS